MKSFILTILVTVFLLISCSTNKYITNVESEYDFEGTWQISNQQHTRLIISKIEDDVYNLKFTSNENTWEGIGYLIDNELLAIFNYKIIDQKGYVTFQFTGMNRINFKSINTDGSSRSDGYYIRLNSI